MAPWGEDAKKLPSGLPDDFIFTITNARFGFPYTDDAGNPDTSSCCMVLKGEINEGGSLSDGDIRLSVGDFEPGDVEGTFAIHGKQDPSKKFSKNSKYGKWLQSAFDAGVPLEENQAPERNELEIRDALMWEGLVVHVVVEEETGVFKKDDPDRGIKKGQEWTSRVHKIADFVGKAGEVSTATAGAAPAATNGSLTEEQATQMAKDAGGMVPFFDQVVKAGGSQFASADFYEKATKS